MSIPPSAENSASAAASADRSGPVPRPETHSSHTAASAGMATRANTAVSSKTSMPPKSVPPGPTTAAAMAPAAAKIAAERAGALLSLVTSPMNRASSAPPSTRNSGVSRQSSVMLGATHQGKDGMHRRIGES